MIKIRVIVGVIFTIGWFIMINNLIASTNLSSINEVMWFSIGTWVLLDMLKILILPLVEFKPKGKRKKKNGNNS